MERKRIISFLCILVLLLTSGCLSSGINPFSSNGGPILVQSALEAESMEYEFVSGIWNVTFSLTMTLTNEDSSDSATIDRVYVTIRPPLGKGGQNSCHIHTTVDFYQSLAPEQSVTRSVTFSHNFTDAELSAFTEVDYDIDVWVPGYERTLEFPTQDADDSQDNYDFGSWITPAATSLPINPVPSETGVPETPYPVGTAQSASPYIPAGLLVWYDFEDDFATTGYVQDKSGNGIDAKQMGNVRIASGIVGTQAIQFDGSGYIRAESNPAAGRKDVTFSFWFKTEDPDRNYKMASAAWWKGGSGSGWTMATHIPEFWAEDTGSVCLSPISNTDNQFLRGEWNFEVVTYNGQTIKEYTNGKLINTWQTRGVPLGAGSPMAIGGWPNTGFYYTGAIDEFMIIDHDLTSQEISALYSQSPF